VAENGSEDGKRVVSSYLPDTLVSLLQEKATREDRSVSSVNKRAIREALQSETR
jgi:hypothetical protein